jgi:hypothetical protein
LTTTIYNNIIEKHLEEYEKNKYEMQLFYQLISNLYSYIFLFPISIGFCIKDEIFIKNIYANIIFIITGLSFQLYFLFKIMVLGYTEYASNQIVSAIDLMRRVIANILAYIILKDYYNGEIIGANICMIIGSIFFLIAQIKKKYNKITNEIIMDEII